MRFLCLVALCGLFCGIRPLAAQVEMQLPAGTRVPVIVVTALSSESAKKGTHIVFAVDSDVAVFKVVVIPKGARVLGTVTTAEPSGNFGHPGKLAMTIDSVQAVDSQWLKLNVGTGSSASQHNVRVAGKPGTDPKNQASTGVINELTSVVPGVSDVLGFLHKGSPMVYPMGTRFGMVTNADAVVRVPESAVPKPADQDSTPQ